MVPLVDASGLDKSAAQQMAGALLPAPARGALHRSAGGVDLYLEARREAVCARRSPRRVPPMTAERRVRHCSSRHQGSLRLRARSQPRTDLAVRRGFMPIGRNDDACGGATRWRAASRADADSPHPAAPAMADGDGHFNDAARELLANAGATTPLMHAYLGSLQCEAGRGVVFSTRSSPPVGPDSLRRHHVGAPFLSTAISSASAKRSRRSLPSRRNPAWFSTRTNSGDRRLVRRSRDDFDAARSSSPAARGSRPFTSWRRNAARCSAKRSEAELLANLDAAAGSVPV